MFRRVSCKAIAEIANDSSGIPAFNQEELEKAVAGMLDAASYYENWRKGLGIPGGLLLVLGSEHAETSWTKLIPKKEEKYNMVIERLQEIKLPELARKYANLEKALVDYRVKVLREKVPEH